MADRKPPRSVGDERTVLRSLLQYQRESVVRKVAGVDEAAARSELVPSGTTLLWLVRHLTAAESLWVLQRFAGRAAEGPGQTSGPDLPLTEAVSAYREMWSRVDEVVDAAPDLDRLCADTGTESPVTLRWVLMHLLEETARHAGHADILRELIDGQTGR